jgi:hypothetical protein
MNFEGCRPSEQKLVIRVCPGLKNNIKSFLFSAARGSDMKMSHKRNRIDTTLGDLIAIISDIALEHSADPKEAYELARLVLVQILKSASLRSENIDGHFSTSKHLH